MTVVDEGAKGKGNRPDPPGTPLDVARRRDARAREGSAFGQHEAGALPDTDRDETAGPDGEPGLVDLWVDELKSTARRLGEWTGREASVTREQPASLHDLALYWRAAPMAGGNPLLRLLQRLDGFTLGVAFTLAGYAFAWIGQRPLRRVTFLLFAFIVWRFT